MAKTKNQTIIVIACTTFLLFGIVTAGIGPVLPELAGNAQTSLTAIGGVLSALFLGALISNLVVGPLSDRFAHKSILAIALGILAMGFLAFTNVLSYWLIIGFAFIAGLGHGAVDLTTNLLVSRAFKDNNVAVLNLLHFFFGVGAFSGPALISLALRLTGSGLIVLWISAGAMLVLAVFYLRMGGSQEGKPAINRPDGGVNVYRSSFVWAFGFLLLISVGVENGMGGWTTAYTQITTKIKIEEGALLTAGFWGLLTIGRLVAAAAGIRFNSQSLLRICLVLSAIGGGLFVLGHGNLVVTTISILIIGFSFGAVYPTVISIVTTIHKDNPGKAASVCAAMGSIGGILIPWMQGFMMEKVSPLASTFFIAALNMLMLVTFVVAFRLLKRTAKREVCGTT